MGMGRGASGVEFLPVGSGLENGFDLGGARIYPWSESLAISPPTQYSNYIGPASGLPVMPPAAALSNTAGVGTNASYPVQQAVASPFSIHSPLPWVIVFMFGAVFLTHMLHYR